MKILEFILVAAFTLLMLLVLYWGHVMPVGLPEWCLTYVDRPPGDVVLDMFAGSGRTGIAALNRGLHPILIEKNENHCRTITGSLEEAMKTK